MGPGLCYGVKLGWFWLQGTYSQPANGRELTGILTPHGKSVSVVVPRLAQELGGVREWGQHHWWPWDLNLSLSQCHLLNNTSQQPKRRKDQ